MHTEAIEALPDVPESLVYELLDGQPLYYKGYRDVLTGRLQSEAVQFSTSIQSLLASLIFGHVNQCLDQTKFRLLAGNPGLHVNERNRLTNNLAVYAKRYLTRLSNDYFNVPPAVTIEIDIRVDDARLPDGSSAYITQKTDVLFQFGVERVIWLLTNPRRVLVIHPNQDWIFTSWHNDVTVMDGCVLNVKRLLDEEEIVY